MKEHDQQNTLNDATMADLVVSEQMSRLQNIKNIVAKANKDVKKTETNYVTTFSNLNKAIAMRRKSINVDRIGTKIQAFNFATDKPNVFRVI